MSITLLIFFLINFHFMKKSRYYRDFFHSLSSNCTIKYENFRSFDFQSDMKLQFLYPTRFMFHINWFNLLNSEVINFLAIENNILIYSLFRNYYFQSDTPIWQKFCHITFWNIHFPQSGICPWIWSIKHYYFVSTV